MKKQNRLSPRPEYIRESTSREKVLKNIRHALIETSDNPFPDVDFDSPIYAKPTEDPDINFAIELGKVGGKFVFCDSAPDMLSKIKELFTANQWNEAFCNEESLSGLLRHAGINVKRAAQIDEDMHVSVTSCEFLISRLGSIMMSSQQLSGRRMYAFANIHIVVAFTSQIVPDIRHALDGIREKYSGKMPSMLTMITGPSRTADIEKTLVMGAHGPKELYVFLADDL